MTLRTQQLSPEQAVVAEHRRLLVQQIIEQRYGSRQAFAAAISRSVSQVGHWLYPWGSKHRKNIGEGLARAIEKACGLHQNLLLVPSREVLSSEDQAYLDAFARTVGPRGRVTLREAAQAVIERWDFMNVGWTTPPQGPTADVMEALRAALAEPPTNQCGETCERAKLCAVCAGGLAEPVQEPVAWRTFDGEGGYDYRSYENNEDYIYQYIKRNGGKYASWVEPLYTAPPQRKPLTEEEIAEALAGVLGLPHEIKVELARAIEKAHGIGGDA